MFTSSVKIANNVTRKTSDGKLTRRKAPLIKTFDYFTDMVSRRILFNLLDENDSTMCRWYHVINMHHGIVSSCCKRFIFKVSQNTKTLQGMFCSKDSLPALKCRSVQLFKVK